MRPTESPKTAAEETRQIPNVSNVFLILIEKRENARGKNAKFPKNLKNFPDAFPRRQNGGDADDDVSSDSAAPELAAFPAAASVDSLELRQRRFCRIVWSAFIS